MRILYKFISRRAEIFDCCLLPFVKLLIFLHVICLKESSGSRYSYYCIDLYLSFQPASRRVSILHAVLSRLSAYEHDLFNVYKIV